MKAYFFAVLSLLTSFSLFASDCSESASERHLNTNPVLDIAVGHLQCLRKGDILGAYRKLSSQDFKDATALEDFAEMLHATPQFKLYEGISLKSISFEEDCAIWQGSLHDKYGLPLLNVTYAIVLEEGKWLIQTMQAAPYTPPQTQSLTMNTSTRKRSANKHYLRQG